MPRYINADKIKFEKIAMPLKNGNTYTTEDEFVTKQEVDAIPTADVREVRHAKYDENDCCTLCSSARPTEHRYDYIAKYKTRYCYFCGAIMDGE